MEKGFQGIHRTPKILFFLAAFLAAVDTAKKRPFYIIGNQINSIPEVQEFLDKGSNVLKSDIQFFQNGSVKEMSHGLPCECDRNCLLNGNLEDYLKHVRDITDPEKDNTYYDQMVVQFFDMKLGNSENKKFSGQEMARHVLEYLWSHDGRRKQEVRVLLYFDQVDHKEAIVGFVDEFKNRGKDGLMRNVGFDGGSGDLGDIRDVFKELGITKNIWLGDGDINCKNSYYPYTRLEKELDNRDSGERFIDKVYAWTIDLESRMRRSLELGVDGIITNVPEKLFEILHEPPFLKDFKIGDIDDDPFAYFDEK